MKIIIVDLEYDYGQITRGKNNIGQLGFKASFENLGHEVFPFYYDAFIEGQSAKLQTELIAYAEKVNPDLIFFCLFRDQFSFETLDVLKSKYITLNWFGDDTWRFDNFTKDYALHFGFCVTTDKFSIPKYKALGVENVIHAQWAAIDDKREIKPLPYKYDISFVGGFNLYRSWFIKELEKAGLKVHCFGHGWKNGALSNDEMINTFTTSKINLNLSDSASFDLRYLLSNIKSLPHTLHTKKHASQIKARNFEINYYAGFQLADYVPGLEDYYIIGKEICCYSTLEDAITQCRYYLENDQIREEIRDQGMKKARSNYTYQSQIKNLLDQLK